MAQWLALSEQEGRWFECVNERECIGVSQCWVVDGSHKKHTVCKSNWWFTPPKSKDNERVIILFLTMSKTTVLLSIFVDTIMLCLKF